MMPINTFYTVVLSAAGTLMGLLFFAVLFNADRRGHKLGSGWLPIARSTLNIYIVLLLFPLVLLFPDFDDRSRAAIILILVILSIVRQFDFLRPVLKVRSKMSWRIAFSFVWLFLAPCTAFAMLAYSAVAVLLWNVSFQSPRVSVIVLGLFIVALHNSWSLVLQHAGLTEGPLKVGAD